MARTLGTQTDSCHRGKAFGSHRAVILRTSRYLSRSGLVSLSSSPHRPVSPMRELERTAADFSPPLPRLVVVVGPGRLGSVVAPALAAAGVEVVGPLGRDDALPPSASADAVLLCVPDAEIAGAAAEYSGVAPLVGHTSGATPVSVLGADEGFGLHPLQTFAERGAAFEVVGCAIGATSPRA